MPACSSQQVRTCQLKCLTRAGLRRKRYRLRLAVRFIPGALVASAVPPRRVLAAPDP